MSINEFRQVSALSEATLQACTTWLANVHIHRDAENSDSEPRISKLDAEAYQLTTWFQQSDVWSIFSAERRKRVVEAVARFDQEFYSIDDTLSLSDDSSHAASSSRGESLQGLDDYDYNSLFPGRFTLASLLNGNIIQGLELLRPREDDLSGRYSSCDVIANDSTKDSISDGLPDLSDVSSFSSLCKIRSLCELSAEPASSHHGLSQSSASYSSPIDDAENGDSITRALPPIIAYNYFPDEYIRSNRYGESNFQQRLIQFSRNLRAPTRSKVAASAAWIHLQNEAARPISPKTSVSHVTHKIKDDSQNSSPRTIGYNPFIGPPGSLSLRGLELDDLNPAIAIPSEVVQSAKRRHGGHSDGGQSSCHESARSPKRRNLGILPKQNSEEPLKFACPFHKHNPNIYRSPTYKSCDASEFSSIARVKEHIYRRHKMPKYQCTRCWFGSDKQTTYERHIKSNGCVIQPKPIEHSITAAIEKSIRSRKRASKGESEPERWKRIYSILFPHDENTPSRHFEEAQNNASDCAFQDRQEYNLYYSAEVPRLIKACLQAAAPDHFGALESAIPGGSFIGLIQTCMKQASESYSTAKPMLNVARGIYENSSSGPFDIPGGQNHNYLIPQDTTADAPHKDNWSNLQFAEGHMTTEPQLPNFNAQSNQFPLMCPQMAENHAYHFFEPGSHNELLTIDTPQNRHQIIGQSSHQTIQSLPDVPSVSPYDLGFSFEVDQIQFTPPEAFQQTPLAPEEDTPQFNERFNFHCSDEFLTYFANDVAE